MPESYPPDDGADTTASARDDLTDAAADEFALRAVADNHSLSPTQTRLRGRLARYVDREHEARVDRIAGRVCLICKESTKLFGGLGRLAEFSVESIFDCYAELTVSTRIPSEKEQWCRECLEILGSGARSLDRIRGRG